MLPVDTYITGGKLPNPDDSYLQYPYVFWIRGGMLTRSAMQEAYLEDIQTFSEIYLWLKKQAASCHEWRLFGCTIQISSENLAVIFKLRFAVDSVKISGMVEPR